MDFKEVYKFPLEYKYGEVFTANFKIALDFSMNVLVKKHKVINILNGVTEKLNVLGTYHYEHGSVYITHEGIKSSLMTIRGWGYMTGQGGLGLDIDTALKIQEEFGNYIVELLNKANYEPIKQRLDTLLFPILEDTIKILKPNEVEYFINHMLIAITRAQKEWELKTKINFKNKIV